MIFDADDKSNPTEDGVWKEFKGSKFLIAHIGNLKFQRALARLQQPHRRKIDQGTFDPGENRKITCQAMGEGIVLNWDTVMAPAKDGQPASIIAYTPAMATKMLIKDAEFREWVSETAMSLDNFRKEEVTELGND